MSTLERKTWDIIFKMEISWSKFLSLITIGLAGYIDISEKTSGTNFRYSLPFIMVMIGFKQFMDGKFNKIDLKA